MTIRARGRRSSDRVRRTREQYFSRLYRRGGRKNAKRSWFQVQGKILERFVDTGQTVKRGQPLMRLDPADLKLQAPGSATGR
jgi:hypothetical protein